MRTDYIEVEIEGRAFRLYFDADEPTALHIYARHGMTEQDAAELFFEGEARWNADRRRFESRLGERVLYWVWLNGQESGTVLVVSCFALAEEQ